MTTHNRCSASRRGLTLIEILVALTMTLIVLGSMMAAFRYASSEMALGRATIEMSNQLRTVEDQIMADLKGMTVAPRPYAETTIPPGFFEYIEGPLNDSSAAGTADNYLGDPDDILHLTVRSEGVPFKGRVTDPVTGAITIVESSLAEVIYFTFHDDRDADGLVDFDEDISLYRRQLVIRPDLDLSAHVLAGLTADEFFQLNDVSARIEGASLIANTLEDLSVRSNRFCHLPETNAAPASNFPYHLDRVTLATRRRQAISSTGTFYTGDDILLTKVAAFDLRVFAPNSVVDNTTLVSTTVEAGDAGYLPASATALTGAYVDLGFTNAVHGSNLVWFADQPHPDSGLNLTADPLFSGFVYDTWTPAYENNGRNDDFDADTDEAVDGFDNDNANGVDDNLERETMPPYGKSIRGMQITLRVVEPKTLQVEQSSIVKSFVPE
ncbi:MAG: prepilin-type N-terminal cleavage/methylation domain-containing protein [Planctomycetota bacterium]